MVVLARTGPHHIVVFGVHSKGSDRIGSVIFKNRFEGRAVVIGLPDITAGHTYVIFAGVAGIDRKICDPAGSKSRADTPELQPADNA